MRRALGILACAVVLTACDQGGNECTLETTGTTPAGESDSPTEPTEPTTSDTPGPAVIETLASGLEVPWGLDFFADGDAIVTERDSKRVLRIAANGGHEITELGTIDVAEPFNEAGLLGVALSPDFERDNTAYFYVSTSSDNRVLRAEIEGDKLRDPEPILTGIPLGSNHDGGRLEFGPDGFLYVSTGETGAEPQLAQDRDSLAGKILRITPNGKPAPGNPFDTEIWTWGHRNVQGLAFDDDGNLWASEFGDSEWDELNLIEPGGNYGWPEVEGSGGGDEYVDPVAVWATADASPSGLTYWDGSLWMAGLRGERLWEIPVDATDVGIPVPHLTGELGRLRTVETNADGSGLLLTTSNTDGRGEPLDGDDRILTVTR